jgi:hypothetical protein
VIHYIFIGLTWALATFGVVGAIAAIAATVYLGPATVLAIIEPLFAKFVACTKCVVAVVFVLATVGAYWVGHHQAEKECSADEKNSELAAQRQDTINAQQAAADEANRAIDIEVTADDQHKKDLADIAALKTRPPTCAFDDIDSGSANTGGVLSKFRPAKAKPAARAK